MYSTLIASLRESQITLKAFLNLDLFSCFFRAISLVNRIEMTTAEISCQRKRAFIVKASFQLKRQ